MASHSESSFLSLPGAKITAMCYSTLLDHYFISYFVIVYNKNEMRLNTDKYNPWKYAMILILNDKNTIPAK